MGLHVRDGVMISHDACTSGTSRVFTIVSLQRMKMEVLIPAPVYWEGAVFVKFLNAQSIASIEIHRQLCQRSFPADFPLLVAQNYHGAPVVQKILRHVVPRQLTQEHKGKRMEPALTIIVVYLFLHLKKFLSGQVQRFQNDREAEMGVTQWFQSLAADFYDRGIQKLIPRYDKYLNSGGEFVEQ